MEVDQTGARGWTLDKPWSPRSNVDKQVTSLWHIKGSGASFISPCSIKVISKTESNIKCLRSLDYGTWGQNWNQNGSHNRDRCAQNFYWQAQLLLNSGQLFFWWSESEETSDYLRAAIWMFLTTVLCIMPPLPVSVPCLSNLIMSEPLAVHLIDL